MIHIKLYLLLKMGAKIGILFIYYNIKRNIFNA